jgi:hypothetical protein
MAMKWLFLGVKNRIYKYYLNEILGSRGGKNVDIILGSDAVWFVGGCLTEEL